jgi:hypothetical protein
MKDRHDQKKATHARRDLDLLSERASEGSITAAIALERALRRQEQKEASVDDELAKLLRAK